jgi:anaphase-promoting complex subunit 4
VGNLILLLLFEQPAAEIIAFRIGELRGLSRWRARLRRVGLHESLMERAMEDSGMLLVQVERLLRIVSETTGQVFLHC